ncbi:MinD/ParA family protein [Leptolyngbyaceae cyanobacterium CCMR0082]|uniref:MinD/ParA family protein n=2 Tax=Adonisia turfae TaxID=2950184 RepID=A0A6M0S7A2_9CYAN|nr:MinD/ParA family protein [Adonisia turfae]MDV3353598.1 MinD/ParA family protein [Leptothoe sp. LEGE 181152]NEZ56006.1 MinD/ParA family protein [Adonisia turfae CCMR0081]NEZ63861.1 MinD/ParA family protein [Adonisia turfae CCMR0082]
MPKVVSVHSYRGGTGKSNFTANLATTIALQGNRVGIVDTDVPSPGIHNLFGLEPEHTHKTLNNYLWGETSIEDAAYDVGEKLGVAGDGKLYLVPSSVRADDIARILKDGYDVRLMNDGFRSLVKTLKLDYLFIDTHPGLSKETFLSIAISHVLILILRPDKQDYQGTAVTVDVARQLKVRKMLLAINKVYSSLNMDALKQKVEETYGETVAGLFPLSEDIVQLASEGVFCVNYPEHPVSQEFRKVAQQIVGD